VVPAPFCPYQNVKLPDWAPTVEVAYQSNQIVFKIVNYFNPLNSGMMSAAAGVVLALSTPAIAASPEYCTVFAQASADPKGSASASAGDTETLQRVYDKAYFECLNADDEPALPEEFVARNAEELVSEGDADATDPADAPEVKPKAEVKKAATKTTKSASASRKKKRYTSGFPVGTDGWKAWCRENYRSFDEATGNYKSFSGEIKPCK
jgi:hypothetical protein